MEFRTSDLEFGNIVSVDGNKITVKAQKLSTIFNQESFQVEVGTYVNCGGGHGDTICLITRVFIEEVEHRNGDTIENKVVELAIIGCLNQNKKFTRGTDRLPTISCPVYLLHGPQIEHLLGVTESQNSEEKRYFHVGTRSMKGAGKVHFDLDKLLGRHLAILGTTGSGKSCTVARIAQSILRDYPFPRLIFFDIHDEYGNAFTGEWKNKSKRISWSKFSLPYWFLAFEEFINIFYPEAGGTQQTFLKNEIENLKKDNVSDQTIKERISVDSPVFFEIQKLIDSIKIKIDGEPPSRKGPWIKMKLRLESIIGDTRFNFLIKGMESQDSLESYLTNLFGLKKDEPNYITILDLSGLPSGVRSICVGVLARMCFDYCYWDFDPDNLPIALILEEAHTYIPEEKSTKFKICQDRIETIAKEGRKYGISLVVVSQRPSNVSPTVLSQCGTFITLRLTNDNDQNKIRRLLPDTLGDQANILPSLRDGEALVSGDAVALPGKVYFEKPNPEPKSKDVAYHKSWTNGVPSDYEIQKIIYSWKKGEK